MNVYLSGDIFQYGKNKFIFDKISQHLLLDHKVSLNPYFTLDENFSSGLNLVLHDKKWESYIKTIDLAIFEVTNPCDLSVGFEICSFLIKKTSVILLYTQEKEPFFVRTLDARWLVKTAYELSSINETLDWCLETVSALNAPRFTFYLSENLEKVLVDKTERLGVTKSEYLRRLIELDNPR